MARIELRQVSKTLRSDGRSRSTFKIEGLDLEVPDGKVLAVLGPSGCGKSTLLRLVAGLIPPDGGRILFDGVDMEKVPPAERRIGMVFQNYALYPNFSSRANVLSYFLFRKRTPELDAEAEAKYRRTAELLGVDIEKLMDRMPKSLSGGERQRVAVGRCITRDPKLFLLDEPFSNLDQKLRERYRSQLRTLLTQFSITTVYVTHDQVEALILADLIAIMNEGRIEQVGTAREIYDAPGSAFAADFINFEPDTPPINLIDGADLAFELSGYTIGARPENISVSEPGGGAPGTPAAPSGALKLKGELAEVRVLPFKNQVVLCVRAAGGDVYIRAPEVPRESGGAPCAQGARLSLSISRYHLFDKASGLRVKSVG
jgi:multiple sugar transport system ATP-binding protein